MRRFFENKLGFGEVVLLLALALTASLLQGPTASGPFPLAQPRGELQVAIGPSLPPEPWEELQVAIGPSLPPEPWEELQVAIGPSLPPEPWEEVRFTA